MLEYLIDCAILISMVWCVIDLTRLAKVLPFPRHQEEYVVGTVCTVAARIDIAESISRIAVQDVCVIVLNGPVVPMLVLGTNHLHAR